jgi:hypothetical protein
MDLLNRYVAHEDDDCTFLLDDYGDAEGRQMLLAHLEVHRWSRSALKRIARTWAIFRQHITVPLFATPKVDDEKWRKFVTRMGWRPTNQMVLCHDGIERPLYIHTV